MDKKALECLVNAPKKDSIISNQSLEIINFKTVIRNDAVMKTDLRVANEKLQAETHQLNLKLARVKKNTPYIGVGCFSLGVGTAIFIYKKVVK